MLVWMAVGWVALNYAFAATLFCAAARRNGRTPMAAFATAALWPREMLRPAAASI